MYCRVVHLKFVSAIQMKMVTNYMEHTMLPRNLAAGQISGEVFKISETEVFTVSKHTDKASADKVMRLMQEELKEIAEGSKITKMEGQILIDVQFQSKNKKLEKNITPRKKLYKIYWVDDIFRRILGLIQNCGGK